MDDLEQPTYQHILVDITDRIAHVVMNIPSKRNALSISHMEELTRCFQSIGENKDIAVVILRGNGPSFCAGHDLQELAGKTTKFYSKVFDVCTKMMETIQNIPQPVIAQVQGTATAAGCQLVASCDLAVADENAKFATPGVSIGLFCSTPMVAVSRNMHRKKMMEMLLTGDPISAEEAQLCGLVNRVVPSEEIETETRSLADRICNHSVFTIGIGKKAFYRQLDMAQEQAYVYAGEVMVTNAIHVDAQEGICAFLEKRKPEWQN